MKISCSTMTLEWVLITPVAQLWGQWLRNSVASMFGNGLMINVLQAYRYLMTHYEPGDRIYLFGL